MLAELTYFSSSAMSLTFLVAGRAMAEAATPSKYYTDYPALKCGNFLTAVGAIQFALTISIASLYIYITPSRHIIEPDAISKKSNFNISLNVTPVSVQKTNTTNITNPYDFEHCLKNYTKDNCLLMRDDEDCFFWHDRESYEDGIKFCSKYLSGNTQNNQTATLDF